MRPSPPAPLTPAVFHILLALAEEPLHGYGIMMRVEETSGREMGPGTIYGAIHRLREAGWVEAAEADATDNRRGRSFVVTALGKAALEREAYRITSLARMEGVKRLAADARP